MTKTTTGMSADLELEALEQRHHNQRLNLYFNFETRCTRVLKLYGDRLAALLREQEDERRSLRAELGARAAAARKAGRR